MDTIFINTKQSKTTEPHKRRLYFTDKLDFRRKKTVALAKLIDLLHLGKYKIKIP